MGKKNKNSYAKVTSLDIRPIVDSSDTFNYYFRDEIFARKKIMLIEEKYTISRETEKLREEGELGKDAIILWVRNYAVTPEERSAGYKGNFAKIFVKRVEPEELKLEDTEGDLEGTPSNRTPLFNGEPFYTLCTHH